MMMMLDTLDLISSPQPKFEKRCLSLRLIYSIKFITAFGTAKVEVSKVQLTVNEHVSLLQRMGVKGHDRANLDRYWLK